MNILNKLTLKHLKMNKKRTLVTIIGITLSTALMVGIGLLVSSLLASEQRGAIKSYGSHHLSLQGVNESDLYILSRHVAIKDSYYYTPVGNAAITSAVLNKKYIYVSEGDSTFLSKLNLVEGRLPKNDHELLVSSTMNRDITTPLKVGTTVSLSLGSRITLEGEISIATNPALATSWKENSVSYASESLNIKETKEYTIVGIISEPVYEDYNSAGYMAFSLNTKPREFNTIYLEFKKPSKTYTLEKDITSNLTSDNVISKINSNLLYYYGTTKYDNVNNTIMPLVLIALSVISIGCIIVIYNSFAISTMERKKSFGLYSSIGATPKQIKKTVLYEALIVGLIGIVLGVLGAMLGIYIVIVIINHLIKGAIGIELTFSINSLYIIIPLIFMAIVILISAYLPAKRSSKVTPIEAIRGTGDIKISPKSVKSPKFIRKIFGIEGDIAYKNIKRNKKKYRITIISLFISIVMFNTFTSFLSYFVKSSDAFNYYDFDLAVTFSGNISDTKKDITKLKKAYALDESLTLIDTSSLSITNLKGNDFTKSYQEFALEGGNLKEFYLEALVVANEDYAKITHEEALLLNNKYFNIYSENKRLTKEIEVFTQKTYSLALPSGLSLNAAVTSNDIAGLKETKYNASPTILMNEDTYSTKIKDPENVNSTIFITSKNYQKIYDDIKDNKISFTSKVYEMSPQVELKNINNIIVAIKILFYGFIALVTGVGVTSVINTINTNINLRKKEFAMLRSIGLTPKGFNKLLFFESLFFGLKSLLYGIPVSLAINLLISLAVSNTIETGLIISWSGLLMSIIGVFLIVILSMNYAANKIKKENILEALREENI